MLSSIEGDLPIFFKDFGRPFRIEKSGLDVSAIFNDPSGVESVAGFDIDFSKPYLELSAGDAEGLVQGDYLVALDRGNFRYQVSARPVSSGDGVFLVPLVFS